MRKRVTNSHIVAQSIIFAVISCYVFKTMFDTKPNTFFRVLNQQSHGHADLCDQQRLKTIVRIRQNSTSHCPDRTPWWLHFAAEMSEGRRQPLVHVNIGCNKGVDFLATLHDLSGDHKFSPTAYLERLKNINMMFSDNGACRQIVTAASRTRPMLKKTRKAIGYCIEPGNKTFQVLQQGMKDLERHGDVFLGQYVMSSQPGQAYFPDVKAGVENKGLSKTGGVPVPVTTLDEYVRAVGITQIDILSIDTEGNDIRVLYGGLNLLVSGAVRVLEFEVHVVGQWAVSRVDNAVAMLDNAGFTCYWHLDGKHTLLRATGCMAEELESYAVKKWSNMACVNRKEHDLGALFEALSLQTESTAS